VGSKLKHYALGTCLFTFLFVVIGGGLHLNPGGAFLAALSGTPLVIYVFNRWLNGQIGERDCVAQNGTQRLVRGQARRSAEGPHMLRGPTDARESTVSSVEG
jgi:hypothetical protein